MANIPTRPEQTALNQAVHGRDTEATEVLGSGFEL